MVGDPAAYGLCFLALVNAGIFILFALSFFNPATARDWRSLGARISSACKTADLRAAIMEGEPHRVRPKAMTVAVIVAGLVPLFVGAGTGSEVMQRIAALMVGGMVTAPLLSMLVLPAAYYLRRRRDFRDGGA